MIINHISKYRHEEFDTVLVIKYNPEKYAQTLITNGCKYKCVTSFSFSGENKVEGKVGMNNYI